MTKTLYLPALQGAFGDWTYYSGLMRLADLAERVGYAHELSSNKTLSEAIQRHLDDEERAEDIAEYLTQTKDRFFGSLVVGVMGGAPSWHPFGLNSTRDDHALGEVVEKTQDLVGYLELSGNEVLFALDGQHRLAGIKKALKAQPKLGDEQVSVIFVAHKADVAGLRRTRGLFIALNKKAVPVRKKDIIILDEVDLPAILTRSLIDEHPWFSKGQIAVERFGSSIAANAKEWTTIGNFYDVNNAAIRGIMAIDSKKELLAADRIRLSQDRIDHYRGFLVDYYTRLSKLDPELIKVFTAFGDGVVPRHRQPPEPRLLFRPIGLKILTRVLSDLRKTMSVDDAFAQAARLPMKLSEVPYVDIIWEQSADRMVVRGQTLAARLMVYMLGVSVDVARLRKSYADFVGKPVEEIKLPAKLP